MNVRLPATNEEAWGLASGWGAEREMNALEAFMWRAEASDARMRSPLVVVELLDSEPEWHRLRAAHKWASELIPRVRMKVVDPPLQIQPPVWVEDDHFDLNYHLRRLRAPEPGTLRQVLDLAAQIAMTPFDRKRPPWEAFIVEGLEDGRAAYVVKVHHSATDGLGGIQLMSLLHSRVREHSPKKPVGAGASSPAPSGLTDAVDRLGRRLIMAPTSAVRQLANGAGAVRHMVADPVGAASTAARFGSSLQRVLSPPPAPPSALLSGRSLNWRFDVIEIGLDELKRAGKAAGGSLNDAYIAAVLGGIRLYHEALGRSIEYLPMSMPLSLRTAEQPMGGNRFGGIRFAAPVGETDPVARIQSVREFVLNARGEPAAMALGLIAPVLAALPARLSTDWYVAQSSRIDVQASNVAGLPHKVFLAGAEIDRVYAFGPLPGCAAMTVLLSYSGTCFIGFNTDRAAVTDADLFIECARLGLEEVLTHEPRQPPRRARTSRRGQARAGERRRRR